LSVLAVLALAVLPVASSDSDGDGYVGRFDAADFVACLDGPDVTPQAGCTDTFDADSDGDVDAADFAAFAQDLGHLSIPLKDGLGNAITLGSTAGYSGRETCGATTCHDVDRIANGLVFQQGRTDSAGTMVMKDDYFNDGRWWIRSAGMYGRWSGGGGGLNRQTAGKDNVNESTIDMTAFYFVSECGGCHEGGGPSEYDRDGELLWNEATGQFGYEVLGQGPGDVVLDGDYAYMDDTDGTLTPARWDLTGVADPGCLHCHRADRNSTNDQDMHREWRDDVLATTTELVDDLGAPVAAFAVAGSAGQGWFSTLDTTANPPVLQIDYSVGTTAGELLASAGDELSLAPKFLARPPRDQVCWGCHLAGGFQDKRGTVWFDERDIHYKKFTRRNDDDPNNDLPDSMAAVCNQCHPNDKDHDFAHGDSPYNQFRNADDWVDFRSCRECHLTENPPGVPNPDRHPDAPEVPGDTVTVHLTGGMMANLSCQTCHVPYTLEKGVIVTDWALTGSQISYMTDEFLSADPIDPTDPDKSTWYPMLVDKVDSDGLIRLFPQKREVLVYWADWDQNGTPLTMADDTIHPIILWRVRQITGDAPLPGVTDDNGDGKLEVNTPAEINLYIQALRANDSYGRPVANNPVLVKGERVWHEDPGNPGTVISFAHQGSGIVVQGFEVFGLDHNVLAQAESWGAWLTNPSEGCPDCHRPTTLDSPVFGRQVLVDPFDENGTPIYKAVSELSGTFPP
jgi:hypothetical protein